ncbi:MAG TPA: calcium/sodium antiporter [Alphaproteobacteria bacterium]
MTPLLIAGGLLALLAGAEVMLRGAVALATRLRMSQALIGLTLVGFGTSTPELLTSLEAARLGSPGIAVGNVVGSNIANVLLILGVGAVLAPIAAPRAAVIRDGSAMVAASLLFVAVCLYGALTRPVGAGFVALLAGFIAYSIWREHRARDPAGELHAAETALMEPAPSRIPLALGMFAVGLAGLLAGAHWLVEGGVALAVALGVSETVIGLTIIAVGTSLPELAATGVAALRGRTDIALGNILGSNLFNILGILGLTAALTELAIPADIAGFDAWVMLGAALLLMAVAWTGSVVSRREGVALLVLYAGYAALISVPGWRALVIGD